MIYLFAGEDASQKRGAYNKFIKSLPQGLDIFSVTRNNFDPVQIGSLYSGQGLFFKKSVVIFENILDTEETRGFILEKLGDMENSTNDFVFMEGKLLKPILDAFKKAKAEVEIFDLTKNKREKFDNFLLANAFGAKDKLNLWIYFRQAIEAGAAMEELSGILFWKIKDMLLKRNTGKFKEEELKNLAGQLSRLLPEARTSGVDAEALFERFLLEAF